MLPRLTFPLLIALTSLPCLLVGAPSHALTLQSDLIQLEPWTISTTNAQGQEKLIGALPDLLDEFERRSGYKVNRRITPYARVEAELEGGLIDFSIMAWGQARARYANRGTDFGPLDFGVVFARGTTAQSYEDLYRLPLCTPRGLKVDPRYDVDATMQKDLSVDYTTCVKKVVAGHGSVGVAGSVGTIDAIIDKLNVRKSFGGRFLFRVTTLSVSWSQRAPNNPEEARVNAIFKGMVEDGTYERITHKWFGKHLSYFPRATSPSTKPARKPASR